MVTSNPDDFRSDILAPDARVEDLSAAMDAFYLQQETASATSRVLPIHGRSDFVSFLAQRESLRLRRTPR